MFVGQTGVRRIVKRACELMKEHNTEDIKPFGGVPLKLIQKYVNFWYTSSLDLFGNEKSSNAAAYFAAGLKGRAHEATFEDHVAKEGSYSMDVLSGDSITKEDVAMRVAMNEILRDGYVRDNENGVSKWNTELKEQGITDFKFTLPSRRFHRKVGMWSEAKFDPQGNLISESEYNKRAGDWLPTEEDRAFVRSLMQQVTQPGKVAGWIAPPLKGINDKPFEWEYVKL